MASLKIPKILVEYKVGDTCYRLVDDNDKSSFLILERREKDAMGDWTWNRQLDVFKPDHHWQFDLMHMKLAVEAAKETK